MLARRRRVPVVALALASLVGLAGAGASSAAPSPAAYTNAVTRICAGAPLFEGDHELGTRADALAVARDIRRSTRRRLRRVAALQVPRSLAAPVARWMTLERRLADVYAESWVAIFDAIAAARTPAQRARMPLRVTRLLHAPDRLRLAAGRIEVALHLPDCTGGAVAPEPSVPPGTYPA